ncbi:Transcriptional activator spt7, partial [Choanephora cucurbitarum]
KQCLKINTLDLTEDQQNHLTQALGSFEAWQEFMNCSDQHAVYLVRVALMEQLIPNLNSSYTAVPLFDTYHTLEFDQHAMLLLEAQSKKEQEEKAAAEAKTTKQKKPSSSSLERKLGLLKELDTVDLKYLVKGIVDNRDKTSLNDHDLCQLLLDVKSSKPKFQENEKDPQEELYEACERVLNDLRNYTEHSFPFLTKVSKREAPDYLDVIKEPMDLGTMARKLKQAEYRSKKEFARDLYLIYDNCLEYNTNPSSEYRKHAVAMRRKTDRLLVRVPDIELKKPRKQREEEEVVESESESEPEDHITSDKQQGVYDSPLTEASTQSQPTRKEEREEEGEAKKSLMETIEASALDNRESVWVEITHKTRARLTWETERQYQFAFGERNAIQVSPFDIERHAVMELMHHQPDHVKRLIRASRLGFVKWMERNEGIHGPEEYAEALLSDLDSEDEQDGFFSKRLHDRTNLPDQERDNLFLPEYNMVPGLPDIDGLPVDLLINDLEDEEEPLPSFSTLSLTQCPSNGLNTLLHQNIERLSDIRMIHNKCKSVLYDIPLDMPLDEQATCLTRSQPNGTSQVELTQEAAHGLLQHAIVHLLSHAGFEGAQTKPMQILTELMAERLSSMSKSLRQYWDDYHQEMSEEEVLLHVLHDHGVEQLNDLDHYVDGIEHYGKQLGQLKEKLEHTYQDLMDSPESSESTLFEQTGQEDAFTIGLFGKDFIEDYFGFQEIGLSHLSSQIPPKLWFGHDTAKIKQFTSPSKELKYHPPPKFTPVTHESQWIGLLQPWYQEQPDRIEDEYSNRKRRPRYPPVHHRSALEPNRKRDAKEGFEETKKKRKKERQKQKTFREQKKRTREKELY